MRVLVVGGAGYIGSHVVRFFADRGLKVDVFDNLSTGTKENLFFRLRLLRRGHSQLSSDGGDHAERL